MGAPVATANSVVVSVDTHIVLVPTSVGPVPTPLLHPFNGVMNGGLIDSVKVEGKPVSVVGSTAANNPAHIPTVPGTAFQTPPANKGTIFIGSFTVKFGGKSAARVGDIVKTCNDPAELPVGQIVSGSMTVSVG